jgi:hypothetical protein
MPEKQPIKNLLHHCEGGPPFFWCQDWLKTGTFAYESLESTTFMSPVRSCSVCGKTAAQMEEENPHLCVCN